MEQHPAYENEINALKEQIVQLETKLQRYTHFEKELSALKQKYADDLYQERQSGKEWLHAYEQLRLQKGGFGFKAMAAACSIFFVIGLVLAYSWCRLHNDQKAALSDFRRDHLFRIEYALSRGAYSEAELLVVNSLHQSAYKPVYPQLEMIREIIQSAEKSATHAPSESQQTD